MKHIFYILLFFICTKGIAQQSKIDSLLSILKTVKEDSNKVKTINALSRQYLNRDDYVKAMRYAHKALVIANVAKLSPSIKNGKAYALSNIGAIYYHKGDYSKALEQYFKSLIRSLFLDEISPLLS